LRSGALFGCSVTSKRHCTIPWFHLSESDGSRPAGTLLPAFMHFSSVLYDPLPLLLAFEIHKVERLKIWKGTKLSERDVDESEISDNERDYLKDK
jgi:hypothetical protein